jgi:hypothetical protein
MYESNFIGGPAASQVFHTQDAPLEVAFTELATSDKELIWNRYVYKRTYLIEPNHDTGVLGQAFYAYQRTEIVETHTDHTSGRHTSNV